MGPVTVSVAGVETTVTIGDVIGTPIQLVTISGVVNIYNTVSDKVRLIESITDTGIISSFISGEVTLTEEMLATQSVTKKVSKEVAI